MLTDVRRPVVPATSREREYLIGVRFLGTFRQIQGGQLTRIQSREMDANSEADGAGVKLIKSSLPATTVGQKRQIS